MAETPPKKTIVLSRSLGGGRRTLDIGQVRQSFSHGRSKTVAVEVKRKRVLPTNVPSPPEEAFVAEETTRPLGLTDQEWEMRLRVVKEAIRDADVLEERKNKGAELYTLSEKNRQEDVPDDTQSAVPESNDKGASEDVEALAGIPPLPLQPAPFPAKPSHRFETSKGFSDENEDRKDKKSLSPFKRSVRLEPDKRRTKISVSAVLNDREERLRSQTSLWRARRKNRLQQTQNVEPVRQVRDVVIPEVISVQELANRMAVRVAEVLKALMRL
ncbi:MAG: translation initiation factor IF-2 associated domain-containing protein, partial [Holosporales bacterium]|nr:translation initiation factor IF-2 associated domain-containing protein [Holosporales bacterium]